MISFIGGAPRAGKSTLALRLCSNAHVGWVSTDLLMELLKVANAAGRKMKWDATPEAISAHAEWFFPYLERFVWGVSSLADQYMIEGVDFLPAQIARLSAHYPLRAVFLGRSHLTIEDLDRDAARSGYARMPEALRRQIVEDVPRWSAFIHQEAERFGYTYVDMTSDFPQRLVEAEQVLTTTA
jgi:hypothetical protein